MRRNKPRALLGNPWAIFRRPWQGWKFPACVGRGIARRIEPIMFSHVVIFWTDASKPEAADAVVAGGNKFLRNVPGVVSFHIGKMVGSQRPVVDQSYQVALNTVFVNKQAQDEYQTHPQHLEFIAQCVKPYVKKVLVYDFE
jgi:hypothetical protein